MSSNEEPNNQPQKNKRSPKSYFRQTWLMIWNGNPPGLVLFLFGAVTAFIMAVPIVYVVWRSLFAGVDRWMRLLDDRIPGLLWNTLSLTFMVTLFAVIIGVSLAWFVNRTDLPGRKTWQWLLALPLVIPPYVGAVAYIIVAGPTGWLRGMWNDTGWLQALFGDYPISIYSFWGVFFVLTMFTYPYVFLIASASLRKMNRNYEEVARSQGMTTRQIFWKINLPFLRPAIGAGAILIALYVLSDFGAIAMLRYNTFTAAIYYQMGSFDTLSATVLSVVLIALTLVILWIESKSRRRQKYYQTTNTYKAPDILSLGRWKWPTLVYVVLIFSMSVIVPIGVLIYWSYVGISFGAVDWDFWKYAWNSVRVSGLAALLCMVLALPIIYMKSRYPSVLTSVIDKLSYSGYALPGVIVALGIIFIFSQYFTFLYNTYYLIAIAFVVRFLPQAMQAGEASLSLISPRMDEAARSLGYPPWKVMIKIIIPSILPGVLAGGALVFVSSIKELPATLLLRPAGFDTLAVRIWVDTSEAIYYSAAPAALLIILLSIIPLKYLLKKY
ncbi:MULTISPECIES: ABC transporter permease [Alteribacter]|uniref:Iron ABC transporter permease n=1 Tax=Alteribacter keqinensis TaxID=2483800 RepID=A0A3M7TLA2_9BACI|nr:MULTISPECIES: iron ABC transporter permease [Alteribacter]MBM7096806.1 iron ABC transporter permease [Alteribacter salitolerans]RNA66339.1 iron ABC transporter permease [Alteribacter keqinensis]